MWETLGILFGLYPKNDVTDLSVHFNAPLARAGFTQYYRGSVKNLGVQSDVFGRCILELDSNFTYISANPVPESVNNNTIIWHIDTISPNAMFNFKVSLRNPGVELMDDTLSSTIKIETQKDDINNLNNLLHVYTHVVASYDPNDKLMQPEGIGTEHYAPLDKQIKYTVRFQNTGNYSASYVRIEDEIDENLDLSSFTLIGASHEVTEIRFEERNILIYFDDINLPPERYDKNGSEGFVTFSLSPVPDMQSNTRIENTADIYFDFNPPIQTNTVYHTLVDMLGPEIGQDISGEHNPGLNTTQTYFVEGDNDLNYVWNFNSEIIPTANNTLEITWDTFGLHKLSVYAVNEYGFTSNEIQAEINVNITTLIEKNDSENDILLKQIQPNIYQISCSLNTFPQGSSIQIIDINGRKLQQQFISNSKDIIVNMQHYSPGCYIMLISCKNRTEHFKIMVE